MSHPKTEGGVEPAPTTSQMCTEKYGMGIEQTQIHPGGANLIPSL